jgi:hypothetical protein
VSGKKIACSLFGGLDFVIEKMEAIGLTDGDKPEK